MEEDSLSYNQRRREIQETLAPRLISEPLKSKIDRELHSFDAKSSVTTSIVSSMLYEVIIEVNLNNPQGRTKARDAIFRLLHEILGMGRNDALSRNRDDSTHPYIFATLTATQIVALIRRDGENAAPPEPPAPVGTGSIFPRKTLRTIFRVWESQKVHPLTTESIRTVKANAAHSSFGAFGGNIVWAVLDSGIDENHAHFRLHDNLNLAGSLNGRSCSFTPDAAPWNRDVFGHGTHVAGIIAGESSPEAIPQAAIQSADSDGHGGFRLQQVATIKGMAPRAKLLILRVLDNAGDGDETALIQAIEYIQQLNDFGRHLVVHGVNISAGFPAHPTWYACGQTPLCVEINRLVKSGVVVVAAAGNSGHVVTFLNPNNTVEAGQTLSINDPGNAEMAITVGSTHRQSPHTFGISYFSSKGPTSDGRRKPEVVAPGEKIISAASSQRPENMALPGLNGAHFEYIEDTGTSMAAPHVSGVIAAFLSVKREFIGQPENVKQLLTQSAMDLGRDANFQGAGLVDLMKLIQSV